MLLALIAFVVSTACTPAIGDPCSSSLECPEASSCDTTVTGGYCLQYDCEYSGCPDEAICAEFPTFTACMQYCTKDGDCRTDQGYVCRNDLPPTSFCFLPPAES